MARTLRDDAGNVYRYETRDEWSADGSAFLEDQDGRVFFGPSGQRVEQPIETEHHEHRVQHAAAAKRLDMAPHEYTAEKLAGQKWCWYCRQPDGTRGHFVASDDYNPQAPPRVCLEGRRQYQRELLARRRSAKSTPLSAPFIPRPNRGEIRAQRSHVSPRRPGRKKVAMAVGTVTAEVIIMAKAEEQTTEAQQAKPNKPKATPKTKPSIAELGQALTEIGAVLERHTPEVQGQILEFISSALEG